MKKVLLLSVCVLLCSGVVFGQAGDIALYVDVAHYVICTYTDASAALVPVYAVHKMCPGATASQWMIQAGNGFNCTYTGEIIAMPTSIGSTQTGISIAYGGCHGASNLLLATINYFCMGASPPCASLEVVPDPAAPTGTIEVIDCSFVKLSGYGHIFIINDDGTCPNCERVPIPVENTSWGRVKALYK